jgi:cyanophycinase
MSTAPHEGFGHRASWMVRRGRLPKAPRFALCLAIGPMLAVGAATLAAQTRAATRVGPPHGTVLVVGGGLLGTDIRRAFIDAAGGPDAPIVVVPTAGGAAVYSQDDRSAEAWRSAGAHNVLVLHTTDRAVANSDSFIAPLARARGVWFGGGRQFHLVDSYLGTRTEAAFHGVLARGGVVGGSSAGATILGDFLVRGAPSNNNRIMDDPRYEKGFAFLRGVAIDQHVVARERLPDLQDSIVPRHPGLFPMSEDEGTAWLVRGDTAVIIGAGQAFAYQAATHDPGKPFVTLHPGDEFNLATRTVMRGASDAVPGIEAMVDGMLGRYDDGNRGWATVLAAVDGHVLVDRSYGIGPQPRLMPTTTLPLFDIGSMALVFDSLCAQLPAPAPRNGPGGARGVTGNAGQQTPTPLQRCVSRTVAAAMGIHRTRADSTGAIESDVDELYRVARGLMPSVSGAPPQGPAIDVNRGWTADSVDGLTRYTACAAPGCRRGVFARIPARSAAVIILTNDPDADVGAMADRVMRRILTAVPRAQ